jgi:glutamate/tyrosine decarboxylase-like PLP-dependent enzyme
MNNHAISSDSLTILEKALNSLQLGFSELPPFSTSSENTDQIAAVLEKVVDRMTDNFPYFHPLYAGQMLKPPHPVARLAYTLSLWINPNNHALDGGRASSAMEKEAVAHIAAIFGWPQHLGHLTSGGTMANLEALWIAGQLQPGKKIAASSQAHYTHGRISGVLHLPFQSIPCDNIGRMDLEALEAELKTGEIGTVVVTMGTTAIGAVDPLPDILELQKKYEFRIHADAAYGGYFALAENLSDDTKSAYAALSKVDSLVIDPHKHGLQPYGCGCVLFRDPSLGRFYKHDSPYTYFSSTEMHLGEISLECSRAGASAVALWATQQLLPSVRCSEFSSQLEACRTAALCFYEMLQTNNRFIAPVQPELDIVFWLPRAESTSAASVLTQKVFDQAASHSLHLAMAELPAEFFIGRAEGLHIDTATIRCLRSAFMKPEHNDWVAEITRILNQSFDEVVDR